MSVEIQTNITEQDLIDFNLYHLSHSPTAKRQRLVVTFLPGLMWSGLWLVLSAFSKHPLETMKALIPLIMGGPLFVLLNFVMWRWSLSRQIQKQLAEGENKGALGPRKIIISPNGLAEISELSQSTTHWEAVEKIVATDDCLYIYLSALSAAIVPKRFSPDATSFEEFGKTAKEYRAQAAD